MDIHFSGAAHDIASANTQLKRFAEARDGSDTQYALDQHVAALFATHAGIGAVLIDKAGHVKVFESGTRSTTSGFTLAHCIFASIQAAIDAAADGDAVYIAAGTYREQLTVRGKHVDLLGAIADDGSSLVTIECPDMANLDVDPVDDEGELVAKCAVVRVRSDAHVTMRHLIIDGRHQGWVFRRSSPHLNFASISTVSDDTVVEYIETRGFESGEVVRLLDGVGRLKGVYSSIQAGISAAVDGDELVIAAGLYGEDLYIRPRLTLSSASVGSGQTDAQVRVLGRVVVAAAAVNVIFDGIAIEGDLEMEPSADATASVTILNSAGIAHGPVTTLQRASQTA